MNDNGNDDRTTKTFADICNLKGTRFKFAVDIKRGHVAEYMVLPKPQDDYWINPIINIHPDSPNVGTEVTFKDDDSIMDDKVILS